MKNKQYLKNTENMVRVTQDLIRKRAEHNECMLSTLEEVSLHQLDVEKIEHIDNWCRKLKILYLQSNLIKKIENVARLKQLDYLNLALNNIETVENLEGCESLRKLDLTVNFVRKLTSIQCLSKLEFFTELYLTGNPCCEYEGYREYVIATLVNLKRLDGIEIEKSHRISAIQGFFETRELILAQEKSSLKYREKEKIRMKIELDENISNTDFWQQKIGFTPETREAIHQRQQADKKKENGETPKTAKKPTRLYNNNGQLLNINQPKFEFNIDQDENDIILDIAVFKHLSTRDCKLDVEPKYVKLTARGKIFQIVLPDEINCENSTANRSDATGHLKIKMPRLVKNLMYKKLSKPNTENVKKEKNEKKTVEIPDDLPSLV